MCGRFTNQYTWRELFDLYRITEPYIHPISKPSFLADEMECWPVGKEVGNVRNEGPQFTEGFATSA